MKHQFRSPLILSVALGVVRGCQISNVIGAGPTAVPPTELPAVVRPMHAPPTLAALPPAVPTTQAVAVSVPAQLDIIPTLSPAPLAFPNALPSPTIQPSVTPPPGCTNPNATITSLIDNGTVSGFIEIKGTVTDPNMEYWKVEYRPETSTPYAS